MRPRLLDKPMYIHRRDESTVLSLKDKVKTQGQNTCRPYTRPPSLMMLDKAEHHRGIFYFFFFVVESVVVESV